MSRPPAPRRRRAVLGITATTIVSAVAGCLESATEDAVNGHENDSTHDSSDETDDTDDLEDGSQPAVDDETTLLSVEHDGDQRDAIIAGDVATVGSAASVDEYGYHYVPMELTEDGTDAFAEAVDAVGDLEEPESTEIHTHNDGEVVESHTLGPNLAAAIDDGEVTRDFEAIFTEESEATAFVEWVRGDQSS